MILNGKRPPFVISKVTESTGPAVSRSVVIASVASTFVASEGRSSVDAVGPAVLDGIAAIATVVSRVEVGMVVD